MTIYTILGGNNDVNHHFIGVLGGGHHYEKGKSSLERKGKSTFKKNIYIHYLQLPGSTT